MLSSTFRKKKTKIKNKSDNKPNTQLTYKYLQPRLTFSYNKTCRDQFKRLETRSTPRCTCGCSGACIITDRVNQPVDGNPQQAKESVPLFRAGSLTVWQETTLFSVNRLILVGNLVVCVMLKGAVCKICPDLLFLY